MDRFIALVAGFMRDHAATVFNYDRSIARICSLATVARDVYDDETKKVFNRGVKDIAGERYDRVPLSKVWACIFFYGPELVTVWASDSDDVPSVQDLYKKIPRETTSKSFMEKVRTLCNTANIADLENAILYINEKKDSMFAASARRASKDAAAAEIRDRIIAELISK